MGEGEGKSLNKNIALGNKKSTKGEARVAQWISARLSPLWPGFDSRNCCLM